MSARGGFSSSGFRPIGPRALPPPRLAVKGCRILASSARCVGVESCYGQPASLWLVLLLCLQGTGPGEASLRGERGARLPPGRGYGKGPRQCETRLGFLFVLVWRVSGSVSAGSSVVFPPVQYVLLHRHSRLAWEIQYRYVPLQTCETDRLLPVVRGVWDLNALYG